MADDTRTASGLRAEREDELARAIREARERIDRAVEGLETPPPPAPPVEPPYISRILLGMLRRYVRSGADLAEIRAAQYYVRGVKSARSTLLGALGAVAGLLLFFSGFVILHWALYLALPISEESKILMLFVLAALYILPGLVLTIVLSSSRRWMKVTKAGDLVRQVTGGDNNR